MAKNIKTIIGVICCVALACVVLVAILWISPKKAHRNIPFVTSIETEDRPQETLLVCADIDVTSKRELGGQISKICKDMKEDANHPDLLSSTSPGCYIRKFDSFEEMREHIGFAVDDWGRFFSPTNFSMDVYVDGQGDIKSIRLEESVFNHSKGEISYQMVYQCIGAGAESGRYKMNYITDTIDRYYPFETQNGYSALIIENSDNEYGNTGTIAIIAFDNVVYSLYAAGRSEQKEEMVIKVKEWLESMK